MSEAQQERFVDALVDLLFAIHRVKQESASKAATPDDPPKTPAKRKRSGPAR